MTIKQLYEKALIELDKVGAPTLLLSDFNHFFMKSIQMKVNTDYSAFELNQEKTDALRALSSTATLPVVDASAKYAVGDSTKIVTKNHKATYEVELPRDYLHLLNCTCIYQLKTNNKCEKEGDYVEYSARRMNADLWPQLTRNSYFKPCYKRPYYYLHNVNSKLGLSTNPYSPEVLGSTDANQKYNTAAVFNMKYIGNTVTYNELNYTIQDMKGVLGITLADDSVLYIKSISNSGEIEVSSDISEGMKATSNFPRTISIGNNQTISTVDREPTYRYGDPIPVRMEIRYGDDSIYELKYVEIDYLKTPQTVELTQELLNLVLDTSQELEFPDYQCLEILNELVLLLMENGSNPRLQSYVPVNLSVVSPTQSTAGAAPPPPRRRG